MHGIELSPAMVAQLRKREGAAAIDVTIGDFATTRPGATFQLAYLDGAACRNDAPWAMERLEP